MALVNVAEQMKMLSNSYRNKLKDENYKTILDKILEEIKEAATVGHKYYFFDSRFQLQKITSSMDIQEFFVEELSHELHQMGFKVLRNGNDGISLNIFW